MPMGINTRCRVKLAARLLLGTGKKSRLLHSVKSSAMQLVKRVIVAGAAPPIR